MEKLIKLYKLQPSHNIVSHVDAGKSRLLSTFLKSRPISKQYHLVLVAIWIVSLTSFGGCYHLTSLELIDSSTNSIAALVLEIPDLWYEDKYFVDYRTATPISFFVHLESNYIRALLFRDSSLIKIVSQGGWSCLIKMNWSALVIKAADCCLFDGRAATHLQYRGFVSHVPWKQLAL